MGQPIPHAAIWKPDGTVVDLNTQLGPNSDLILLDALAINDNGDIAGIAGQLSTGKEVGFLLPAGYVVDSTGDEADKTPGDGNCATATATCTLRAALQEVNGDQVASPTSITFSDHRDDRAGVAAPGREVPGRARRRDEGRAQRGGCRHRYLRPRAAGRRVDGARAGDRQLQGGRACGSRPPRSPSAACRRTRRRARSRATRSRARSGPAVAVASGVHNLVQGNRMTGNGRPAIDLGADGRTPNDAKDADGGANGRHNFPIGVLAARDPVSKVADRLRRRRGGRGGRRRDRRLRPERGSGRARRRADGLRRLDRGQLHGRLGARRPRLAARRRHGVQRDHHDRSGRHLGALADLLRGRRRRRPVRRLGAARHRRRRRRDRRPDARGRLAGPQGPLPRGRRDDEHPRSEPPGAGRARRRHAGVRHRAGLQRERRPWHRAAHHPRR